MDVWETMDWDEAREYQPGLTVELKSKPGFVDTIAAYEPMMVPPIWLTHDPRPRYPHELRVVCQPVPVAERLPERLVCYL